MEVILSMSPAVGVREDKRGLQGADPPAPSHPRGGRGRHGGGGHTARAQPCPVLTPPASTQPWAAVAQRRNGAGRRLSPAVPQAWAETCRSGDGGHEGSPQRGLEPGAAAAGALGRVCSTCPHHYRLRTLCVHTFVSCPFGHPSPRAASPGQAPPGHLSSRLSFLPFLLLDQG